MPLDGLGPECVGGNVTNFLGNDAELLVNPANPTGLLTPTLHPDVMREGFITSWAYNDHLASNRLVSFNTVFTSVQK